MNDVDFLLYEVAVGTPIVDSIGAHRRISCRAELHILPSKQDKLNARRPRRDRRSHGDRLTVDLTSGTLTALKIHVARRGTTIRAVVTALIQREIAPEIQRE